MYSLAGSWSHARSFFLVAARCANRCKKKKFKTFFFFSYNNSQGCNINKYIYFIWSFIQFFETGVAKPEHGRCCPMQGARTVFRRV